MKLFYKLHKTLKNGFYIDYLFKTIFVFFNNIILKKNMFYLTDKYLAEIFIFNLKKFFSFFFFISEFLKKLSIINIFKLTIIIIIQIIIIILL